MSTQTASTSELQTDHKRIAALESEVALLRRMLDAKRGLEESYKRYTFEQEQRLIETKLQAVSPENNVWLAVHTLLKNCIRTEHVASRDPSLPNECIRYNLGRETGLEDFQALLLECWARANKPVIQT